MPRFYFHLSWADDFVRDEDGVVLQDFRAATTHGNRLVDELLRSPVVGALPSWTVWVCDADGAAALPLHARRELTITGTSWPPLK